jgi:hypothetical protein
MDIKNIWEILEWAIYARKLIEELYKFAKNEKIILLLRHSERYEIESG